VETSETEHEQNGKMERTAEKHFLVKLRNFAKTKIFA